MNAADGVMCLDHTYDGLNLMSSDAEVSTVKEQDTSVQPSLCME